MTLGTQWAASSVLSGILHPRPFLAGRPSSFRVFRSRSGSRGGRRLSGGGGGAGHGFGSVAVAASSVTVADVGDLCKNQLQHYSVV